MTEQGSNHRILRVRITRIHGNSLNSRGIRVMVRRPMEVRAMARHRTGATRTNKHHLPGNRFSQSIRRVVYRLLGVISLRRPGGEESSVSWAYWSACRS